jgi:hypothetical protein
LTVVNSSEFGFCRVETTLYLIGGLTSAWRGTQSSLPDDAASERDSKQTAQVRKTQTNISFTKSVRDYDLRW